MVQKGVKIEAPSGKLGVLIPGLGAVSTTFIAGVEAVKKKIAQPIGSLTQLGTIRLGKRTEKRVPMIKDFVPLAGLEDLVFGAWSQRGENNEYQAIRDEHNAQKRKQMIEEFLDKNKNSQFRPELDVELMNLYVQNRDWAQLFQRADRFYLEVPSADAKSRVQIYTRGMLRKRLNIGP